MVKLSILLLLDNLRGTRSPSSSTIMHSNTGMEFWYDDLRQQ